jgi:hypothetical protein
MCPKGLEDKRLVLGLCSDLGGVTYDDVAVPEDGGVFDPDIVYKSSKW